MNAHPLPQLFRATAASSAAPSMLSRLMEHARFPDDPVLRAFAGVISQRYDNCATPLIRGLGPMEFQRLMKSCFPGMTLDNGENAPFDGVDEFDDLVALLSECRVTDSEALRWLSHAVATAALGDNHLWQDMGLPGRALLTHLMASCFPVLAARNAADMKWKKFFYRQLCERAGILLCKSPNCGVCSDFGDCFGPEEG